MLPVTLPSPQVLPLEKGPVLIKTNGQTSFRIGKAAKMALHVLTVSFAAATAFCAFTACVITAPWIIPVMIVCAAALSILFTAEVALAFIALMKGKQAKLK